MNYSLAEFKILQKNLTAGTHLNVLTTSMEPYIRSGELVEVEPITVDQLEPYDIIVYWEEKRSVLICHIFKEVRDGKIICMPLAINKEDKPFHPTLLLARASKLKFGFFQKQLLKWFR